MTHRRTGLVSILRRAVPGLLITAVGLALAAQPAAAQVDGISYTLTPVYNPVYWDPELGLSNTELWGGRLGYNLGRRVSLTGYYMGRDGVSTRLTGLGLTDLQGDPLVDQQIDVLNYGADLVFNMGSGPITAFVKGGGGILQLTPEMSERVRTVNLKLGGGFRFGIDRFHVMVYAEDSAVRLDRYDLAVPSQAGFPDDPDQNSLRHTLSLGLGVDIRLGGRTGGRSVNETDAAFDRSFERGLTGLSIPVEVFGGRLNYNEKLALASQDLVGLRSGLDFGRFFGLRLYYWRGLEDGLDDTAPVQSWGGEARFNLSGGEGALPYLVGGVGQLDYLAGFVDENGEPRSDRSMLIFGGGLAFTVSDRFKFDASARNHLFSDDDLTGASSPSDLYSNWMLGASVSFNLFGGAPDGRKGFFGDPGPLAAPVAASPQAASSGSAPDATGEATPADVAGVAGAGVAATSTTPGASVPDTARVAEDGSTLASGVLRNYQGSQFVTLPVPVEGEIYIRYGQAGGVDIQSRNLSTTPPVVSTSVVAPAATPLVADSTADSTSAEAMRQVVRDELAASGATATGITAADLAAMETRLNARIDQSVSTSLAAAGITGAAAGAATQGTDTPGAGADTPYAEGAAPDSSRQDSGWALRGSRIYAGADVDDPTQFLVGGRLNLGRFIKPLPFDLMPEATFGWGDSLTTSYLALNLLLKLGDNPKSVNVYLVGGFGLLLVKPENGASTSDGVFSPGAGLSVPLGKLRVFGEYQGLDWFDRNRVLVGFRLGR